MRILRRVALVAAALAVSVSALADFHGIASRVIDGDTLEIMRGGEPVMVRLYGIDAPERRQKMGMVAKAVLQTKVEGQALCVMEMPMRDRYGRTIAVVVLEDGTRLNCEMVFAGMAWWYKDYAKHDCELERLEKNARESGRGLWKDENPVPPWEYRKRQRSQNK